MHGPARPIFFGTSKLCGAIALAATFVGSSGCGAVVYTADVISAGSVVAEAEQAGAADLAPYEFYAAQEYLAEAREEASEASYEDAIRYAQAAGRLAREAQSIARRTRSERRSAARSGSRSSDATSGDDELPPSVHSGRGGRP